MVWNVHELLSLSYLGNVLQICPQFLKADSKSEDISVNGNAYIFKEVSGFASRFEDS